MVAHRGAHTDGASENSIAALRKAMDANYYGVELDVWMTADGRIVVHHDGHADGLVIQDEPYTRVKDITLSNGEKLPTLDSFLKVAKLEGEDITDCVEQLEGIGKQYNITFVLSVSMDKEELPEGMQDKIIVAL